MQEQPTVGWGARGPVTVTGRRLARLVVSLLLLTGCQTSGSGGEAVPAADLAAGEALYVANCAACHGVEGQGQPNWQQPNADGQFPPPPHDSSGHTWHHPDALLLEIIAEGGQMPDSGMPAFKDKLSPEEMEAVLAYIKSFWGAEERALQEQVSQQSNEPVP
jgi:mono/diheme cytochrome c family protein